ncbi:Uncharacterised protein [Mycobacteroides abscessus subsp. abscessus]|nr:Uncharacterised protein [Mycobacteroides abscessus subsp. abscessus]
MKRNSPTITDHRWSGIVINNPTSMIDVAVTRTRRRPSRSASLPPHADDTVPARYMKKIAATIPAGSPKGPPRSRYPMKL